MKKISFVCDKCKEVIKPGAETIHMEIYGPQKIRESYDFDRKCFNKIKNAIDHTMEEEK